MSVERGPIVRIEQLHLPQLGHASYVVGPDDTGDAIVVDPQRDVRPYLEVARREGWRIRWVADTHQHNDYLSGLRELSERTGASFLRHHGHDDIVNLLGGMSAWKTTDLPTTE